MPIRDDGLARVEVERQTLYEQVWTIPGAKLAVQYGISDVGLAKVCRRYWIPRPTRGYWARLAAGQKVKRKPLPAVKDPAYDIVVMQGWALPGETVQRMIRETKPSPSATSPADSQPPMPIHPLAETTRAQLKASTPDSRGLVRSDCAVGIDVRLAPASIDRCVAILDRFIRAWESKGGRIEVGVVGYGGNPRTVAAIGDDHFAIEFREVVDESRPITDPLWLSGKLELFIGADHSQQFRKHWRETKSQRLERMVKPIVETLANALEVNRLRRLDAECVARQEKHARDRREARAAASQKEFRRRQQLTAYVERWHQAQRIREYLAALRASLAAGKVKPHDPNGFQEWLDWAAAYADSIDSALFAPLPGGKPGSPSNVPIEHLDLTSGGRRVISQLSVEDSNGLWQKSEADVRAASEGQYGPIWGEFTRVLEGLGYDVSKRREASYW